ncbi:4-hydroxythreonine-4-phosphate dehydrogenase PdxA [Erythrobacter sp. SDW2]|uniref:4-hydroxythreonine-4-phosphate dehydrogenase PdxA n=1 Tax=Erythrobacter sp. SDW2 TaxID=2907154 RepID=UPI001F15E1C5|nr:4-hydroxythreonine-4-phosphate dehydrogenase PdxA [Erythrobacter sp. SDW2]UIP07927.1 4-hydroxythreonine-4-phosphate dehydrogenase PdxA [Erythrobacter sp. SDW2]
MPPPRLPPLVVSIGDPAGIGPEIIVQAWLAREAEGLPPFCVVDGDGVLQAAADTLGLACPVETVAQLTQVETAFARALPVIGQETDLYRPGRPGVDSAQLAYGALERAIARALQGAASGVVTAPVSKAGIAEIAPGFCGQTEMLADLCGLGHDRVAMMLAGPSLRAVPLTVHVALAAVSSMLTSELIVSRGRITAAALHRDFGIAGPRLAVTGLNPHAGEGGQFGREEIEIIGPAIEQLRAEGIDITGPHSADALFTPRGRTSFDAALCMYHDQALIPVKALDFDAGVNVTLGLPIIRTSPDHGTAFDIAGKGIADPGAMIAAIRMAGECAVRRANG